MRAARSVLISACLKGSIFQARNAHTFSQLLSSLSFSAKLVKWKGLQDCGNV